MHVKRGMIPKRLDLDAQHWEGLQRIGAMEDRPVAWLVRKAIQQFIERYESRNESQQSAG